MVKTITQKKEKQDILVRCFGFLLVFILLNSFIPISLDFTPPIKTIEEKPNYFNIVKFLAEFNFDDFTAFNLIPEFQGSVGRINPFQSSFDQIISQDEDLNNIVNVDNEDQSASTEDVENIENIEDVEEAGEEIEIDQEN